jgi:sterol desaturase/sphingolipid hydroxylase (fatty acid hydroxylase superfamily)
MKKDLPKTKKDIWLFLRYFKKLLFDALYPSLLIYLLFDDIKWRRLVKYFNYSDQKTFVVFQVTLHFVLYTIYNNINLIFSKFELFKKYKIKRESYQIPSNKLIIKTAIGGYVSILLAQPIIAYYLYNLYTYFGTTINGNIPSFYTYFFQIMVCSLLNDVLFYFMHRILHHESIYFYIHKQHHEYRGSISYAAEYSHPIESVTANFIPTIAG